MSLMLLLIGFLVGCASIILLLRHGYGRKWQKIKTRNKLLLTCCCFVIIYTVVDIVMGFFSLSLGYTAQLDSTLTAQVFDFAKWVVVSGAAITVAKTCKGDTNSDESEPPHDRDIPPE
jgi:small-conductance mechanosensitive channel